MDALLSFCKEHGLEIDKLSLDGEFHPISTADFKGWYIGDEKTTDKGQRYISFTLGDWKTGERHVYFDSNVTDKGDLKELERTRKANEAKAKAELEKAHKRVSDEAFKTFEAMVDLGDAPYAQKKRIKLFGAKAVKNTFGRIDVVVPMRDTQGKTWGYQTIEESGAKQFLYQQRIDGCYFQFGTLSPKSDGVFICEGFATGASIHEATGKPVIAALNANNLPPVTTAIRKLLKEIPITICADEDQFTKENAGRMKAIEASKGNTARIVFPQFADLVGKPTDFNDLHLREGLPVLQAQLEKAFQAPDEVIETEHTGFHHVEQVRGKQVFTPDFDGLRQYFNRLHPYVGLAESRMVYVFDGRCYRYQPDLYLAGFAEEKFNPKPKHKDVFEFTQKILRTNLRASDWFESSTVKKVNFRNGVLDLETKTLLPHSPEFGFRYCLEFDYEPAAKAPRFERMLREVTCGDDSLRALLLEYAGYALSGDACWTQKALVLEGEGSNGKSTFINVLRHVLGPSNCSPLSLNQLHSEYNRQMLEGKLANFSEETPNRKLFDSSTFKALTGGAEIQARAPYKAPYSMRNRAKLIFACNELPESDDTTKAFFRRLLIVPFRATFDKSKNDYDPHIEEKLKEEAAGIFNLCWEAYEKLLARGSFTDSKAAQDALDEYRLDIDPIDQWIRDHLEFKPVGNGADEKIASITKIYSEFAIYADQNNLPRVPNNVFGKKLRRKVPDYIQRVVVKKEGGKSIRALKATILNIES